MVAIYLAETILGISFIVVIIAVYLYESELWRLRD